MMAARKPVTDIKLVPAKKAAAQPDSTATVDQPDMNAAEEGDSPAYAAASTQPHEKDSGG